MAVKRRAAKTRSEVFQALQSNGRYNQLHKTKDKLAEAIKHARASRSKSLRMLEGSFDKLVRELNKMEDAALKQAGF